MFSYSSTLDKGYTHVLLTYRSRKSVEKHIIISLTLDNQLANHSRLIPSSRTTCVLCKPIILSLYIQNMEQVHYSSCSPIIYKYIQQPT